MSKNTTAVSNVIQFRRSKLLLVDQAGEPFVAMKPVVEGMGLAWQTQHRKLMAGRFASVITMMVTTGFDGKQYEMACLPLRKLPGWLMSIHASKVREELRENVIAYQNECDDALWAYWNQGHAVNHRDQAQSMTLIGTTIGTDGFHCLAAVVDGKVKHLPAPAQRGAKNHIWSQVHKAFSVVTAEDIPAEQLANARNFIAAYAVKEGEYIAREPAQQRKLDIHYPLESLTCRRPEMLIDRGDGCAWLDVKITDLHENFRSPCEGALCELERAGYDITGAWWEVRTLRNKLRELTSFVNGMSVVADEPKRYAVRLDGGQAG
ncbi:phage antirepressor N-terminal domain-containing protein [Pseudomonas typographi]|uniref:phage antirepressor N-terminal domain-containing protein n=1 Tax=Pseudomonas typographi TaxID=2715964 RepID=UPI001682FC5D|nr:phage antirepressor N-terminal domain-containing protein [Pseudomonas typographi]MBD1590177.1 hypothetical protein [Pseudomonas typographi]